MGFVLQEAVIQLGITGMSGVMSKLSELKGNITGLFGSGFAALVGGASLTAVAGIAISKALAAEEGAHKMKTALEANGLTVADSTAKFNELARSISNATTESKGHVKELLTAGINMGLNADQAAQYTKAAIGLSHATGKDATEALAALTAAGHGQTMSLERLAPQLKGISDQHQLLAAAQKLATTGMKEASGESETANGKWEKLHQSINSLLVKLGTIFLPIITAVIEGIQELIDSWSDGSDAVNEFGDTGKDSMDKTGESGKGMGSSIQAAAKWIKDAILDIGFWFKQLPIYAQEFWVAAKLRWSQIVDVVVWATDVMVSTFLWLVDNWRNILGDIFNLGKTIFSNLADNIINAFKRAWNWISGNKEPVEAFKSLTEGFKTTTTQLVTRKLGDGSAQTKQYQKELEGLTALELANDEKLRKAKADGDEKRKHQKDKDKEDTQNIELGDLTQNKEKKEGKGAGFSDLISIWKNLQTSAMKQNDPQHQTLAENKKQTAIGLAQVKLLEKLAGKKPNKTVAG